MITMSNIEIAIAIASTNIGFPARNTASEVIATPITDIATAIPIMTAGPDELPLKVMLILLAVPFVSTVALHLVVLLRNWPFGSM